MGDMANHPTPMAAAANEVQYFANSKLFILFLIFSGEGYKLTKAKTVLQ